MIIRHDDRPLVAEEGLDDASSTEMVNDHTRDDSCGLTPS